MEAMNSHKLTYFTPFLHFQFHAMLLTQFPKLLSPLGHMTPSRHLSILTGRLSQCLTNHKLATFHPSALALGLLSLELETVSRDWLTLSMMFQRLIGVSISCNRKEAMDICFRYSDFRLPLEKSEFCFLL